MNMITIGKLAQACKVRIDTVRYYEQQQLLMPIERTATGYRLYTNNSIQRLNFIKQAKTLGFTLNEIKELLQLNITTSDCGDVQQQAKTKLAVVEQKISDLQKIQNTLNQLIKNCPGKGKPLNQCNILNYFYTENNDEQ